MPEKNIRRTKFITSISHALTFLVVFFTCPKASKAAAKDDLAAPDEKQSLASLASATKTQEHHSSNVGTLYPTLPDKEKKTLQEYVDNFTNHLFNELIEGYCHPKNLHSQDCAQQINVLYKTLRQFNPHLLVQVIAIGEQVLARSAIRQCKSNVEQACYTMNNTLCNLEHFFYNPMNKLLYFKAHGVEGFYYLRIPMYCLTLMPDSLKQERCLSAIIGWSKDHPRIDETIIYSPSDKQRQQPCW